MIADRKGKRTADLFPESPLSDQLDSEPTLDRLVQERIGDNLRAMYDDLMQQPVPDRFVELLRRLEKRGNKGEQ
jgi:Anti-sigma factor NepR